SGSLTNNTATQQTSTFTITATAGSCSSQTIVSIIVNPRSAVPINAVNGSNCGPGTVSLSASSVAGTTIDWYDASTGGTLLGTGSSFTTPSISATTTFYAEARNTTAGCISATRLPVTATVNTIPNSPTPTPASRCGTGTVTLTATGTGTIKWYSDAGLTIQVATGTSYTTPSLSTSATYYLTITSAQGCVSTSTSVTATINPFPAAPTGTPGSRCGTGTVTLTATPGAGETVDWYNASTGGTLLLSGSNSFTTPSISATTNYFAVARNTTTGCLSTSRTQVTATVNTIPAAPTTPVNGTRCGPGTVNLSASSAAGTTIDWYDASTGGTLLGTGSSFTTPSISATTTFYAEARNTTAGCISATRLPVTATVNTIPNSPTPTPASRCGTGTVTLTATGTGTIKWYSDAGLT